jgi:hypothetical protein
MKKMFANFVRETTATVGTGNVTLVAATGYPRFNDRFVATDRVYYTIRDGNNWEEGWGTYNGANVLARTTILQTYAAGVWTAGGAALTLSGAATVWTGAPEEFLQNLRKMEPVSLGVGATQAVLAGYSYRLTGNNADLTLPATPDAGDSIEFLACGATNGTIRANGNKINATIGDMTLDVLNFAFSLTYVDATFGWKVDT